VMFGRLSSDRGEADCAEAREVAASNKINEYLNI